MSGGGNNSRGTAVITGASSGIGKVYAERLAERGYDLLLVARRGDRLREIAAELQGRFGRNVDTLAADLAQPQGLATVVERLSTDEAITLLVNNAGTSATGPVAEISAEVMQNLIALNITALTALTRAVLPGFLQRDKGTIINIGSVVGFTGYPWVPVYGATKAYVMNFTQALQAQVAETRVRVQLVTPAATVSEIWEVSGMPLSSLDPAIVMTTEDCVDAALRGLDDGEPITSPSLEDIEALRAFERASMTLLEATQRGKPATRYGLPR